MERGLESAKCCGASILRTSKSSPITTGILSLSLSLSLSPSHPPCLQCPRALQWQRYLFLIVHSKHVHSPRATSGVNSVSAWRTGKLCGGIGPCRVGEVPDRSVDGQRDRERICWFIILQVTLWFLGCSVLMEQFTPKLGNLFHTKGRLPLATVGQRHGKRLKTPLYSCF